MKYKMAAFDLDGTLLNSHKQITAQVKAEIARILRLGVQVILATGRPVSGVLPIARELHLTDSRAALVCFNGGIVSDGEGNALQVHALTAERVKEAVLLAVKHGLAPVTYREDVLLSCEPDNPYVLLERDIARLPVFSAKAVEDMTSASPKVLMVGEPEKIAKAQPVICGALAGKCDVYCSTPYFLEVMPAGVSKVSALAHLLQKRGLKREQLVCMGDGMNDLEMMHFAGMGVAMGNAARPLLEQADMITDTCDAHGVAKAIRTLWV